MRDRLVRSTGLAVIVALLVVGGPLIALAVWAATQDPEALQRWVGDMSNTRTLALVLGVIAGLSLVALAVGFFVANRESDQLVAQLVELSDQAEKLGAGESRITPLTSGISEVDAVSAVLARSAQRLTKSLASERDFAADASHQLRTPLTALLMRLEEISMTDDVAVVHEESQIAISQVERLTKVVDDLLARTRSAGESKAQVSLDSVLAALQREWQPSFASARRSIKVDGERDLSVQATPAALSQVMSTLLENSLAHGRGTVLVNARRTGPSVVVEVSDQGEGVPASIAAHIFERSVTTTGTGLGLALARDLAESLGGRLELVQARPAIFALFLSEA